MEEMHMMMFILWFLQYFGFWLVFCASYRSVLAGAHYSETLQLISHA